MTFALITGYKECRLAAKNGTYHPSLSVRALTSSTHVPSFGRRSVSCRTSGGLSSLAICVVTVFAAGSIGSKCFADHPATIIHRSRSYFSSRTSTTAWTFSSISDAAVDCPIDNQNLRRSCDERGHHRQQTPRICRQAQALLLAQFDLLLPRSSAHTTCRASTLDPECRQEPMALRHHLQAETSSCSECSLSWQHTAIGADVSANALKWRRLKFY